MKLKALVTAELIRDTFSPLEKHIDFEYAGYAIDREVMSRKELLKKVADIDILICEYDTINKEVFNNAPNLKLIVCCRGGVKSVVDLDYAKEKGVIVCNNAGRNATAVADIVLGFILDLTRNISKTNSLIHNRVITMDATTKPDEYADTVWGLNNDSPFVRFRGDSVSHMTLGLVGFGHTGRLVAERAVAFGMKILAYDPYLPETSRPENVEFVDFPELLSQSDIISLHCIVSDETRGLFNKDTFAKMKKGSYFINTARGELVDENALIDALNSHHLKGAALDVTFVEPIYADSPLLDAENLILTPHIAGSAYDVQVQGSNQVFQSLTDYINGETPLNCVT